MEGKKFRSKITQAKKKMDILKHQILEKNYGIF